MDITNKAQAFELFEKGLFGNKLRHWFGLDTYINSKTKSASVSVRYRGSTGDNFCIYNSVGTVDNILMVISNLKLLSKEPIDRNLVTINESAPDEKLTIQGELFQDASGYSLFYSTDKGKMRDCLKNGKSLTGLSVKLLLQQYMTSNSFADMMELLDMYPEHCIEFSTYSINLGNCLHRNTIIWEVRKY